MATGSLPFRGDTSALIFQAILDRLPTSPIRLNPDLPAKLEDVINKALEKDRNLRYQHASDMRTDLQRLKRDTDTGRVAAVSGSVEPSHDSGVRPAAQPVPLVSDAVAAAPSTSGTAAGTATAAAAAKWSWTPVAFGAALLVAVAIAGAVLLRSRKADALTEKDTVVVADFANTTGDAMFDGTLKQALSVDLEQSPFLRVVPQSRVQQTLASWGGSPMNG